MKNRSLAFQIWIVFAGVIVGLSIILVILFPIVLRNFFTDEVYHTIEAAQKRILTKKLSHEKWLDEIEKYTDSPVNIRDVRHIVGVENKVNRVDLYKLSNVIRNKKQILEFLKGIEKKVKNQKNETERYVDVVGGKKIFYEIWKFNLKGKEAFIFSYMGDTYRNSLVMTLFKKLILIMILAVIISLIVAVCFAKYLTKPLVKLQGKVKKIGEKDWYQSVNLERKDEIGQLSDSIENMRIELIKKDEQQKSMIQSISHELKTPVMVIRSYLEAVEDGIFPKGNLKSTIKVINYEAKRLEKRIKDLIYICKFEYMFKDEKNMESINLKVLILNTVERFKFTNIKIKWHLDIEDVIIRGIKDQWNIVFENILDNQIRYARENISICINESEKDIIIKIHNDGEKIQKKIKENLFKAFSKGKKGNFGLGMYIVKCIVDFHKGNIGVCNEDDGVSFYIKINKTNF